MIRKINFNGQTFDVDNGTDTLFPCGYDPNMTPEEIMNEVLRLDDALYTKPETHEIELLINANLDALFEAGVLTRQYRCTLKRLPGPRDFSVTFTDFSGNIVSDLV